MSFLNQDSFSRDYDYNGLNDSVQSQAGFLKVKLIETHEKLIRELQVSRKLEQELQMYKERAQSAAREADLANKKLQSANAKAENSRYSVDKSKQIESALLQSQKKNDLLRVDLESMRGKVMQVMAVKNQYQERIQDQENQIKNMTERIKEAAKEIALLGKELRQKQLEVTEVHQQLERYRGKYEKQVANNEHISLETDSLRKEVHDLNAKFEAAEMAYRQEKDKNGKLMSQMHLCQKQLKEGRSKNQSLLSQVAKLKDEIYLAGKTRNQERSAIEQLQKLTSEYNALHSLYRAKQKQLQQFKRRPLQEANRKKNNYENTRELVSKLEREETQKISARYNSKSRTPNKGYKQEKQEYLSLIEEVGSMEGTMLACNVEKKRILSQIDRIDETRVKTKEMIARRRRLQVELQTQDRKIDHAKSELKKLKVM